MVLAKMLISLAVISNNRIKPGVGLRPWQEDFDACQIPWAKRGKRMDEMVAIINGLMTGEYFSYEGELISVPEIKLCPVSRAGLASGFKPAKNNISARK